MKQTKITEKAELNKVIVHETRRPNGTIRRQLDFTNCPTMAEQHTAHLTNVNYLMEKYKPDELAAYLAARMAHRQEIMGHDFSNEPELQDARTTIYNMRKAFDELPEDIKYQFKNHVEFLKFIDNPANQEKMIKLGLLTKTEIKDLTQEAPLADSTTTSDTKDVGRKGATKE